MHLVAAKRHDLRCSKLVDHETPDPPAAWLPPPDCHVATSAMDRRAGLGYLNLLVPPDIDRVIAGDEEIGALQGERRNAVLRHLVDDERVDGHPIQVGSAREEKLDLAGESTQR